MSIQEYTIYYQTQQGKLVKSFLANQYGEKEFIQCSFDVINIDITHHYRLGKRLKKIEIAKKDYFDLLCLMLKYPDLTFEDLPIYISPQLYEQLIVQLHFPRFNHISQTSSCCTNHNPVAVDMITIRQDVLKITGEKAHNFLLQSYTPTTGFQESCVKLWMKQMEIAMSFVKDNQFVKAMYGMIDVETIKKILHVKTYKGIESALMRLSKKLSIDDSNIQWISGWLDNHNVKYVYAEDVCIL